MRALVFEGPGKLAYRDVPVPRCGPDEVLFKVLKASICNSSDYHIYEGTTDWKPARTVPHVFGHEQCGRIVEVGEDIEGFAVGDRIAFSCALGAFAEYNVVNPRRTMGMVKLPRDVSDEEGSLMEMLGGTLIQCVHPAGIVPGERALIVGQGPMGLVMTQLARIYGAGKVVATDLNENRLTKAKELGADMALNASRLSGAEMVGEIKPFVGEVDVAIVAVDTDESPDKSCLKLAIECLRERGRLTGLSSLERVLQDGADREFVLKAYGKSLRMARSLEDVYPSDRGEEFRIQCDLFARAVDWIRGGRLDLKSLITHRVAFDDIEETLKLCKLRPAEAIKAVVEPPGG